jgi:hypothetical protein
MNAGQVEEAWSDTGWGIVGRPDEALINNRECGEMFRLLLALWCVDSVMAIHVGFDWSSLGEEHCLFYGITMTMQIK